MDVSFGRVEIVGIEYEVRAGQAAPAVVRPSFLYLYDAAGRELRKDWIDYRFGELAVIAGPEWRRGRFEAMVTPDVARLTLDLGVTPLPLTNLQQLKLDQPENPAVAGVAPPAQPKVWLRNLRLVRGGFDPDAVFPAAPYLPWIQDLHADRGFAIPMRFADAEWRDLPPRYLWAHWLPKSALSKPKAGPDHWRQQVQPFLDLPPDRLAALFPSHPPVLGMGLEFPMAEDLSLGGLTWDPAQPAKLRRADGTFYEPDTEFQATGSVDYLAPNGERGSFAYREQRGPDGKVTREYREAGLTRIQVCTLLRAAYVLAVIHRVTGDSECAVRSGVILAAFAKAVPGWPNFGAADETVPYQRPLAPDAYGDWFSFVLGGWYTPATGSLVWPAKTYDLIKDAPVWDRVDQVMGEDARDRIAAGFLHIARESLLRDAACRSSPWKLYHNTTGSQLEGLIAVGRAIGCPELVHYAVRKMDQAIGHYLMADGVFPESPSYTHDQIESYRSRYNSLRGYSDPPGYVSRLGGTRFDNFTHEGRLPVFDRAVAVMERQVYPDGSILTLHDTWPGNPDPAKKHPAATWLMPDFGHAILGRGADAAATEAHLHYSGFDNHAHRDALNFTLWAYGDELLSDLGYTHFGQYCVSGLNHNLVLIDGREQNFFLLRRNDLTAWAGRPELAQVAQAQHGNPPSYSQASIYRRAIVSIPFGSGRDAVIDLFEAVGGKRHEWLANGCATYAQQLATNLTPDKSLPNLAPDGKAVTDPHELQTQLTYPGGEPREAWYGAFRNARVCRNNRPWQATMTAGPPVPAGTPGASARAMSAEAKPGLRLHWLAPCDGDAIFCEAPRHRYYPETKIWGKDAEFATWWNQNLMPKIIVRRDGTNLNSLFLAAWEPFQGGQAPWLDKVEQVPVAPADAGTAVRLQAGSDWAALLCRKPETGGAVTAGDLSSTARFVIHRRTGDWEFLELVAGRSAATGTAGIDLTPWPELEVVAQGMTDQGDAYLDVRGDLSAYPTAAAEQPHAGREVRFQQAGQAAWWLPLARIENPGKNGGRLLFLREIGFRYDPSGTLLTEQVYPYRITHGTAKVTLPAHAALKWRAGSADFAEAQVLTTAPTVVRLGDATITAPPAAGWQKM